MFLSLPKTEIHLAVFFALSLLGSRFCYWMSHIINQIVSKARAKKTPCYWVEADIEVCASISNESSLTRAK